MKKSDQVIQHRDTLIHYLKHKVTICDWHGVADAACDLREIEVELRMLHERERENGI
jgi:hypothetical protein